MADRFSEFKGLGWRRNTFGFGQIYRLCFLYPVAFGLSRLPRDLNWRHVLGAGLLGGIGFTMSIFITNLAFIGNPEQINASKMAILLASLTAGIIGFLWLRLFVKPIE